MSGRARQIDQLERVLDLLGQARNAREPPEHVEPELAAQRGERRDGQVLAHREAGEQLVDLVALGEPELADVGHVHAGDVAALEHDRAGGRRHLAGQHLEEGRLAGAVRADDAAQLAVIDREIDVAVGDEAAVALGQAARLQDRAAIAVDRVPRAPAWRRRPAPPRPRCARRCVRRTRSPAADRRRAAPPSARPGG